MSKIVLLYAFMGIFIISCNYSTSQQNNSSNQNDTITSWLIQSNQEKSMLLLEKLNGIYPLPPSGVPGPDPAGNYRPDFIGGIYLDDDG